MTNLEWVKNNFNRLELSNDDSFCEIAFISKTGKSCVECKGTCCSECQFRNIIRAIGFLLQERKEPIKLKKWEYDLIDIYCNVHNWKNAKLKNTTFFEMKDKGYFKGVIDTSMTLEEILNNCEVVDD